MRTRSPRRVRTRTLDPFYSEWADKQRRQLSEYAGGIPLGAHEAEVTMIRHAEVNLNGGVCPNDGTPLVTGGCRQCAFRRWRVAHAMFWCWNCRKEFSSGAYRNENTGRYIPAECPHCGAICREKETKGA